MLRAGLIDELSVLVVPVADGSAGTPTLFDVDDPPSRPETHAIVDEEADGWDGVAPIQGAIAIR